MVFIRVRDFEGRKYCYLVANYWVKGKVKQKVIRYLGKPEDIARKLDEYDASFKGGVFHSVGDYWDIAVLFRILEELDLITTLDKHTFKGSGVRLGKLASIMVINHCIDSCSKRKINQWYRNTYLSGLIGVTDNKVNNDVLCNVLDYFTDETILNIEKDVVKQLEKLFKLNKEYLFYDMTSTYFEGSQCSLTEVGYSKDKRPDKKQVNFALVVSRIGKFPLMHRIFKGNVRDISTLTDTANTLKPELDINTSMLILDRGMLKRSFRNLKSFIKIRPIRHWLDRRVKAHIFLCILAYLLESVLEYKIRKMSYNMTGWELLEKLHRVSIVSYKKGDIVVKNISNMSIEINAIFDKLGVKYHL